MSTKTLKTLAVASCAALFLGGPFGSANAQDLAMKTYEVADGVSFILPAEGLTVEDPKAVNSKFLIDAKILSTVEYKKMRTEVTSFQMDITANPVDFLSVFAKALGLKFAKGQVIRNKNNIVFGVGDFILPSLPDQPFTVAVAFADDRGYIVQSKTTSAAALTKTVVKDMQIPGAPWGTFEPLQPVTVGTRTIDTNAAFKITEISEGPMKGVIATNAATMEGSSIIMVVKTNLLSDHAENRRVFEGELASANLEHRAVRETAAETIFLARSKADTSLQYMGFVTTNGTASISLIVPTAERDPNAWLSGKYYYSKALRDLRN